MGGWVGGVVVVVVGWGELSANMVNGRPSDLMGIQRIICVKWRCHTLIGHIYIVKSDGIRNVSGLTKRCGAILPRASYLMTSRIIAHIATLPILACQSQVLVHYSTKTHGMVRSPNTPCAIATHVYATHIRDIAIENTIIALVKERAHHNDHRRWANASSVRYVVLAEGRCSTLQ